MPGRGTTAAQSCQIASHFARLASGSVEPYAPPIVLFMASAAFARSFLRLDPLACNGLAAAVFALQSLPWGNLWLMNRNARVPGRSNKGKRAVSHVQRKAKKARKGTPTLNKRGR